MKVLTCLLLGWISFNLQALGEDLNIDSETGLPTAKPANAPVRDMYHFTETDEADLQTALADYNMIQGEYQDLASKYSVISFKALDSGPDGCRIEMGDNDYFLHGYKASSDRHYSGVRVRESGDYTYTTVNNSTRTIPSYTLCSREELTDLEIKRKQVIQAQVKYSMLTKNKATKIVNEKALNANIESAEKGECYGLRRMAERYRKGEGVEKNVEKADDLSKKADEAEQSEESRILVAKQMREEADAKQKFQRTLKSADAGDYNSAATVARCYRDGNGTEKDLNKALEYFHKAQTLKRNAQYDPIPDSIQSEIDQIEQHTKTSDKRLS
jgi:hypothetical protein